MASGGGQSSQVAVSAAGFPPARVNGFLRQLYQYINTPSLNKDHFPAESWGNHNSRPVRLGKFLSMLLRHRSKEFGISADAAGFVDLADVCRIPAFQLRCSSAAELHWVVRNNPKGRFEFKFEETGADSRREGDVAFIIYIRALQGHSGMVGAMLDPDIAMHPVTRNHIPPFVAHGTSLKHVNSIIDKGLIPGGTMFQRTYVHFTLVPPNSGRVTGLPNRAEVLIHLDLDLWLSHGFPAWYTGNGVLCIRDVIPKDYFRSIILTRGNSVLDRSTEGIITHPGASVLGRQERDQSLPAW